MITDIFGVTFAVESLDGRLQCLRLADFICNCGSNGSTVGPASSPIVVRCTVFLCALKLKIHSQRQWSARELALVLSCADMPGGAVGSNSLPVVRRFPLFLLSLLEECTWSRPWRLGTGGGPRRATRQQCSCGSRLRHYIGGLLFSRTVVLHL